MRIINFGGIEPKTQTSKATSPTSIKAVDVDLYGSRLQGLPAHVTAGTIVDVNGVTMQGKVETLYYAGSTVVGFAKHTTIAPDPLRRLGDDTFLFVDAGKLWRTSSPRIANKLPPLLVTIDPPADKPYAVVAPSQGCTIEAITSICDTDAEDCDSTVPPLATSYRYTYVSACGDESAPSPPSDIIDLYNGDGAQLIADEIPPANATTRRWYKSYADTKGAIHWLSIQDAPISQSAILDYQCDTYGELITENHLPPVGCIQGVAALGDNVTAVWTTRNIYISEPMLPHAYKEYNKLTVLYDIVTLKSYIDTVEADVAYKIAVLTDGLPYIMYLAGADKVPVIKEVQDWQPCASAKSAVTAEGIVFYTSMQGVVAFTGSNARVITNAYYTELEWRNTNPATQRLCFWSGRLWGFFDGGGGYQFRVSNSDADRIEYMSTLSSKCTACIATPDNRMVVAMEATPTQLVHWCADVHNRMRYIYKTYIETQVGLWYPTSIKIEALRGTKLRTSSDAKRTYELWKLEHKGNMQGYYDANPDHKVYSAALEHIQPAIDMRIYADEAVIWSRSVTHNDPTRIPRKLRALRWAVEVESTIEIQEIHIQTSYEDMTQEGGAV